MNAAQQLAVGPLKGGLISLTKTVAVVLACCLQKLRLVTDPAVPEALNRSKCLKQVLKESRSIDIASQRPTSVAPVACPGLFPPQPTVK